MLSAGELLTALRPDTLIPIREQLRVLEDQTDGDYQDQVRATIAELDSILTEKTSE
jgi:hypothetical protein